MWIIFTHLKLWIAVVDRVSETQLQVGENSDLIMAVKGLNTFKYCIVIKKSILMAADMYFCVYYIGVQRDQTILLSGYTWGYIP